MSRFSLVAACSGSASPWWLPCVLAHSLGDALCCLHASLVATLHAGAPPHDRAARPLCGTFAASLGHSHQWDASGVLATPLTTWYWEPGCENGKKCIYTTSRLKFSLYFCNPFSTWGIVAANNLVCLSAETETRESLSLSRCLNDPIKFQHCNTSHADSAHSDQAHPDEARPVARLAPRALGATPSPTKRATRPPHPAPRASRLGPCPARRTRFRAQDMGPAPQQRRPVPPRTPAAAPKHWPTVLCLSCPLQHPTPPPSTSRPTPCPTRPASPRAQRIAPRPAPIEACPDERAPPLPHSVPNWPHSDQCASL